MMDYLCLLELLKKIGVSLERLRYWENLNIVRPKYVQCGAMRFRRYSEAKGGRKKNWSPSFR